MALDPGTIQGEEVQVGSKTYIWDGIKWNLKAVETVVDTLHVQLSNPLSYRSGRLNLDADGYPEPDGLTTQSGANEYMQVATDWLKENGGGEGTILIQSSTPDVTQYEDGTLWVDTDTYDLFVLSGGQWIDLTALPNMSDYVKDSDLQFTLNEYLRKRDAFDTYYPLSSMIHFLQPNGTFKVHLGDGAELDNIITRLIDAERDIIHIQGQIDGLGGDGETPPDANHPGGQYVFGDGFSGTVVDGMWHTAYDGITTWNQIYTFYIADLDLEGDNTSWDQHVGDFVQVHRYIDNPHTGADFSSSAVYRINSVNDQGSFDTINVSLQDGTARGTISPGQYFTFEIIEEGTF